ncbi:hypothetical protein [Tritonibacter mobilis]|uniref:hypothetical protein n=1 Tax=Tritonibacter mobilis TaxID=379347 RepID=UPI0008068CFD|nr:hypothetical protein [Tritonibacter mobilis]
MATSTEQINNLIAGYTDLKEYFEGARDRIQTAIDTMYDPKTIYVDSNVGDDANEGTTAAPVRTFGKALTMVPDGGKSIIRLREGLEYGTSGGNTSVSFRAGTVLEVNRWGGDAGDAATHPILHLESRVLNGKNATASTIYAYGPFQFIARSIRIVCDVPQDESLGWGARKFIRVGHYIAGTTIDLRFNRNVLTVPPNAVQIAGPRFSETVFLGVDNVEISGDGALITDAAYGTVLVSAGNVTASGTTKLLDGGTIGQNVLTNSPAVTL